MKVLVCGGRQFNQPRLVGRVLAEIHTERRFSLVISGGANGADRYGEDWARHNRVPLCVFPANWQFEGKRAGPVRNAAMLQFAKPDLVVAFPGGPGTEDMMRQARMTGVTVIQLANPQPVDRSAA